MEWGAGLGALAYAGVYLSGTLVFGSLAATAGVSFGSGIGIYALERKLKNEEIDVNEMLMYGVALSLESIAYFGMGFALGNKGLFPKSELSLNKGEFLSSIAKTLSNSHYVSTTILRIVMKSVIMNPLSSIIKKSFGF